MPGELNTVVSGVAFPECLRWHDGKLWFSDVLGGKVFSLDPKTSQVLQVVEIAPMAGGLGWLPNGDLVVVDIEARKILSVNPAGQKSDYLDLSLHWTFPANDMLIDNQGTMWVGSYGFNPETDKPQSSSLARLRNGQLDFPTADFIFPNGIAQIDSNHLVVAETFADRLAILRIHADGNVEIEKRIHLSQGATPDGLTVDQQGQIWVASAYGEAVLKINPETEVIERAIEVPGHGVFDCTFGGHDLQTLFIATSDKDESRALIDLPGEILAIQIS